MSTQIETVTISLQRYKELEEIEQLSIKRGAKGNISGWNGYTYFSFGDESVIPKWFQKQAKENERISEEMSNRLYEAERKVAKLEMEIHIPLQKSLWQRIINKNS